MGEDGGMISLAKDERVIDELGKGVLKEVGENGVLRVMPAEEVASEVSYGVDPPTKESPTEDPATEDAG